MRTYQATGMKSGSEVVDFAQPVELSGEVERYLTKTEEAMRSNIKRLLDGCLQDLRKLKNNSREKWIEKWPGQLVITASQIYWTNECKLALLNEKNIKNPLKKLKKILV